MPTSPSALTAPSSAGLQQISAMAVTVPFTLGSVAQTLGNEINAAFLATMIQGVPAASASAPINTSFASVVRDTMQTINAKLDTASGSFTRSCSRGGTVVVRYAGSTAGGAATLSSTEVEFTGCTYTWETRTVTFHGTLRATGTFRASRPAEAIHLEGEIRIDEIGGPFLVNGDTGPYLNGTITPVAGATGGTPGETFYIGSPETSTSGSPTTGAPTTGTPTTGTPTTGTPTTGTPTIGTPTGTPTVNITGTWGVNGQPSFSFVQNGRSLTGQFLWPDIPVPGVEVVSNGLSGDVMVGMVFGGGVTMRGGDSTIGYITAQVITTAQFSISANSMTGFGNTETRFTCTGLMKDACPPSTATNWDNLTLTRIGTVQSGTYDLSGRWAGNEMIQLQQDGGGNITGSVIAGDISEQSVSGRNENNRVSLRVRYTARENTGSVDYSRSVDRTYELTAYEPSSIGGFLTTVTTERCTAKDSSATAFCADRNKTERTAENAMLMRR